MIINVSTGFLLVPWLLSLKGTLLLFLNLNLCKILFLHFVFIQHNWHQMNFCTEFYFVLINGEVKGIIVVNRKKKTNKQAYNIKGLYNWMPVPGFPAVLVASSPPSGGLCIPYQGVFCSQLYHILFRFMLTKLLYWSRTFSFHFSQNFFLSSLSKLLFWTVVIDRNDCKDK